MGNTSALSTPAISERVSLSANRFLARFYLIISVPTLILLCFLIQPLHSLDEPAHFLRIAQLSKGSILPVLGPDQKSTGSYGGSGTRDFATFYGERFANFMKEEQKTSFEEISKLYQLREDEARHYVQHSNTTIYFPLAYAAPVLAFIGARAVTDRPLIWFYAGRLVNALIGVALTYCILLRAGRGRFLLFGIALLPITMFQTAALSADSLLIPAAMGLAVLIGHLVEGRPLSRSACVLAALAGAVVGLGKIAYLPLVATPPLVAILVRRRLDGTVIGLMIGTIAIVVTWALWSAEVGHLVFTVRQSDPGGEIDVQKQLALITTHPLTFVNAFIATLTSVNLSRYAASLVGGILGWFDIKLALPITFVNFFVLIAAMVIDDRRTQTPWLARAGVYFACLACTIAVFLLLYLQWNAVGAGDIVGVQGRYFLPLLPFLCIVTPCVLVGGERVRQLAFGLVVWGGFSALVTLFYVAQRYWTLV